MHTDRLDTATALFSDDPDPLPYFPSRSAESCVEEVTGQLATGAGVIVLIGNDGAGKTRCLQRLAAASNPTQKVIYANDSSLIFEEFLVAAAHELGMDMEPGETVDLTSFQAHLNKRGELGQSVTFLIDDAEEYYADLLECLAVLVESDFRVGQPLQVVLAGSHEFERLLSQPHFATVRDCVISTVQLEPMAGPDIGAFVHHGLTHAGLAADLFDETAIACIAEVSSGNPALVQKICRAALAATDNGDGGPISAAIIERVAADLPTALVQSAAEELAAKTKNDTTDESKPASLSDVAWHFRDVQKRKTRHQRSPVTLTPLDEPGAEPETEFEFDQSQEEEQHPPSNEEESTLLEDLHPESYQSEAPMPQGPVAEDTVLTPLPDIDETPVKQSPEMPIPPAMAEDAQQGTENPFTGGRKATAATRPVPDYRFDEPEPMSPPVEPRQLTEEDEISPRPAGAFGFLSSRWVYAAGGVLLAVALVAIGWLLGSATEGDTPTTAAIATSSDLTPAQLDSLTKGGPDAAPIANMVVERLTSLQAERDTLLDKNRFLNLQLDSSDDARETLLNRSRLLQAEVTRLEAALQDNAGQPDADIQAKQAELEAMTAELAKLTDENAELRQQAADAAANAAAAAETASTAETSALSAERDQLLQQVETLENEVAEVSLEMERAYTKFYAEQEQLRTQLAQAKQGANRQENAALSQQQAAADVEQARQEAATARQELTAARREIQQLTQRIAALEQRPATPVGTTPVDSGGTPGSAAPSDTAENNQVRSLLTLAERQIEAEQLTTPIGDNALESYKKILSIQPNNEAALAGLETIKDTYQRWAEHTARAGNLAKAQRYYIRALAIDPDDPALIAALESVRVQEAGKNSETVQTPEETSDSTTQTAALEPNGPADADAFAAAVEAANLAVVRQQLANGVAVDGRDNRGRTALMRASVRGHLDLVRLLLANQADPNLGSPAGETPLMYAVSGNHMNVLLALIENGADVNGKNDEGWTPLIFAAIRGRNELVDALVARGSELEARNKDGKTALSAAAWNGHTETVNDLLKLGADVNAQNFDGWTALMYSAWNGHEPLVQTLVNNGADLTITNTSGQSALEVAIDQGHTNLISFLR